MEFFAEIVPNQFVRKILPYPFVGGSRAKPPEAKELSKIVLENPMETSNFFAKFHEFWENFLFKMIFLIKK